MSLPLMGNSLAGGLAALTGSGLPFFSDGNLISAGISAEGARALLGGAGRQVVYSTLVFVLVAPVCAWLARRWPRRTAPLRAGLWSLVLLRLVLPPDLSLGWSLRGLLGGPALEAGSPDPGAWPSAWHLDRYLEGARVSGVGGTSSPGTLELLPWLLLALWGVGSLALAAWWWARRRRHRSWVREGRPVEPGRQAQDEEVLHLLETWRRRSGVRRPVRAVVGEEPVSPFTVGTLRPVIYLPEALLDAGAGGCQAPSRASRGTLEAALAHELAHVARFDDLRLLGQWLVQALWFFHPVAWLAGARLAEERERSCDHRVLARGLCPRTYSRALLAVASLGRTPHSATGPAAAPAFGRTRRRLPMRIREILDETPGDRSSRRSRTLPALLAAGLLGLLLLPMAPVPGAPAEAGEPVAAVGPGPALAQLAPAQPDAPGTASAETVGTWLDPVPRARLTSPYGQRVHPFTGERKLHRGVDLAAATGTPVLAPAAGRVRVATERWQGGERHGTVVILDHGEGLQSFYSHLDSLEVRPGQRVREHQRLGTVGSTGEVTGPHLHLEVWRDGEPVDPATLVAAWR